MATLRKSALVLCAALIPACTAISIIPQWKPSETSVPAPRIEIPLVEEAGDTFIRIPGKKPYLIAIDTGCRDVTLSPAYAEQLALERHVVFPSINFDASGVETWSWTAARVKDFPFGPVTFHDFDADVFDFSHLWSTREPVAAIAGLNLFHDCLLTIDYPRRRLVIEHGELPPENGQDILKYRWQLVGNLEIEAKVDGRAVWAKIDTGCYGELSLSEDNATMLKLERPYESTESTMFAVGSPRREGDVVGALEFGKFRFNSPHAIIGGRPHHVIIGNTLLGQFAITIDQKNHRIRFVQRGRGAVI